MKRQTIFRVALVALVGSSADACRRPPQSPAADSSNVARAQNLPAASADSVVTLLGTQWRLEALAGVKVLESVTATLTFPQAGRVAGNGSCNRFAGPVMIRADSISFGALVMTRMACAEPINAQEARFVLALEGAERFAVSDNRLSIYSKGSQEPLTFVRTKPS